MIQRFSAKIYKQGISPCVDVPPEVSLEYPGLITIAGFLTR